MSSQIRKTNTILLGVLVLLILLFVLERFLEVDRDATVEKTSTSYLSYEKTSEEGSINIRGYQQDHIIGGYWPSKRPYMDLDRKVNEDDYYNENERDVKLELGSIGDLYRPLKSLLYNLSVWENQKDNARFVKPESAGEIKPGVIDMRLIFSVRDTYVHYFPYFQKYEQYVMPIVNAILGPNMLKHVAKLQFARIGGGAKVNYHKDTGPWVFSNHRIHVPIYLTPETKFTIKSSDHVPVQLHLEEGSVFEINNRMGHQVVNEGSEPRIHLIMDVNEQEKTEFVELKPGQVCHHGEGKNVNRICEYENGFPRPEDQP